MSGSIDTDVIDANSKTERWGDVSIKAATDIKTNSIKGGTVAINSTSGSITLDKAGIETSSAKGATASINVKSGNKIKLGEVRSNLNFDNGNAGNIKIEAVDQISLNSSIISRSSQAFNSGNVKIVSQNAGIDFTWTGDNNPGISTRSEAGIAGSITVEASGDITKNALDGEIRSWSENGGKAGNVKIASNNGKVLLGKTPVRAWADVNDAGNVKIEASGDIEIGAVASNVFAGKGKGGNISVTTSKGNITSEYLRSDSINGAGGNITLDARAKLGTFGGTVKVINTVNISGAEFSIFAGINGDPKIKISHVPIYPDPDDSLGSFTIGDAKVNGSAGIIMAGTDVIVDTLPIKGSYTLGNIIIKTLDLASNEEITKRVQKSFNEALKPIGIDITARELTNRTGIPALVSYLPEIKRLQAAKELAVEAASNDPKLSADKLLVASKVFFDIKRILDSSQKYGVTDKAQIAYILATASWESQFGTTKYGLYETSFNPIGSPADINYFSNQYDNSLGNRGRGSGDGFRYRGRGYVQLTGRDNYTRFQQIFGVDITATSNQQTANGQTKYSDEGDPDKVATDRNLAADILVLGIRDDLFTQGGRNIGQFISGNNLNFFDAREIINGDKNTRIKGEQFTIGELISRSAQRYLNILKKI